MYKFYKACDNNKKKGMDLNLGKIPGAININEPQKIILLGTARTHPMKNSYSAPGFTLQEN